jgi:hypothetical protein
MENTTKMEVSQFDFLSLFTKCSMQKIEVLLPEIRSLNIRIEQARKKKNMPTTYSLHCKKVSDDITIDFDFTAHISSTGHIRRETKTQISLLANIFEEQFKKTNSQYLDDLSISPNELFEEKSQRFIGKDGREYIVLLDNVTFYNQ